MQSDFYCLVMAGRFSCRRQSSRFVLGALLRVLRTGLLCLAATLGPGLGIAHAAEELVQHNFGFDAQWESRDIEILDFRYGRSNTDVTSTSQAERDSGTVRQAVSVGSVIPLGDDLYVKWRIRATGQVIEDTVQLKGLLPADMRFKSLRFIVQGSQLYVYVIFPRALAPDPCFLIPDLSKLRQSKDMFERLLARNCSTRFALVYPGPERRWP